MIFLSFLMCVVCFLLGLYFKKLLFKLISKIKNKKDELELKDEEKKENDEDDYEIDFEEEDLKMVFLVREDLKMSVGKVAAQVCHAGVGLFSKITSKGKSYYKNALKAWDDFGSKKIVLKAKNLEELENVHKKCKLKGIPSIMISDAGHTEVEPGTVTVLGIGPEISEKLDKITGSFRLMR